MVRTGGGPCSRGGGLATELSDEGPLVLKRVLFPYNPVSLACSG